MRLSRSGSEILNTMAKSIPQFLTASRASRLCDVSPPRFFRAIHDGRLEPDRLAGRIMLFHAKRVPEIRALFSTPRAQL